MFALCSVLVALGVDLCRRARRSVGGVWQAAGAVCYRSAALLAVVPAGWTLNRGRDRSRAAAWKCLSKKAENNHKGTKSIKRETGG